MTVSLQITTKAGHSFTPVWQRFVDHMEQRALTKYDSLLLDNGLDATEFEVDQELEIYGAWSNWTDWHDPLWFPDQESLTAFLLTYG